MSDAPVKKRTAALGFIFITIFVDTLGLGIIIPVFPKLLQLLGHVDVAKAAEYSGYLTFIYAVMQFIFSSVLGNLSDRFGRRPVLLISLFGFSIDYVFMAFAPTIAWLFVGRVISGISGASSTTATAYIADISTGDKRTANFGMVNAASGLGFILGVGTGAFLGSVDIKYPFMAAAALALFNGLYGLFALPESLSKENRRPFDWKRANPIGSLFSIGVHKDLIGLIAAFGIVFIGQKAVEYVLPYFLYEKFHWNMQNVGTLGIYIGFLLVGIQAGLIRYLIPRFGQAKNIIGGLFFYMLGLVLIAFATKGWMCYVFMIPYCLGGISGPALQGLITGRVEANAQGELQGALTSISSISVIIGPLLMAQVFYHFTKHNAPIYFPGAPYLFGAILMLISIIIALFSIKGVKFIVKKE
jgi:DHA1 family tetracycline resistance protein-like MFS transporter